MVAVPRALAPLRHPAYRLLAASMALSLLTSGLWIVSLVWQVVALDGGPAQLSLVTGLSAVGMLASTLFGGALADRIPQRHILLAVALVQAATIALVAVLSLTGHIAVWHLAGVSLAGGIAAGLYYPAYSALVPALLPADDLLPANGLEGVLRPVLVDAAGPAAAAALVSASPRARRWPRPRWPRPAPPGASSRCGRRRSAATRRPRSAACSADVRDGFRYLVRTPWLFATLAFASLMVLAMIGPLEVLMPFAVRDAGGGPAQHAWVLAAFGVGGALGSLVDRLAAAAPALPDRHEPALGAGLRAAGGLRAEHERLG